jgi:hypothetical protein
MIDPYDNWLSSPYDDYYDDDEEEEQGVEDDGSEAYAVAKLTNASKNAIQKITSRRICNRPTTTVQVANKPFIIADTTHYE